MKLLLLILLVGPSAGQARVFDISPGADIQWTINRSAPGDTISFVPGNYNIAAPLTFAGNRTYQGNGAVLNWMGGKSALAALNGSGITITGLTFDGSGLCVSHGTNETVTHCTFQNITFKQWTADNGIFFDGLTDSSVTHNTFVHCYGDAGIFGYNPTRCHFDDNTMEDVTEGMHFNGGQTPIASNSTINRNVFSNIVRYALEMQLYADGLEIAWNWADNFKPADRATLIFSCPSAGANYHWHHNYLGGTGLVAVAPDGGQTWGFELGGSNTECDHNLFNGSMTAMVATMTTAAWSYHDNTFAGVAKVVDFEFKGAPPSPANVHGNQQLANRVAAPTPVQITSGAYWGVNSGAARPAATQPATQPAAAATTQPAAALTSPAQAFTGTATGNGKIQYTLSAPLATAGALQIKSTKGADAYQALGTLPAGTTTFTLSGINAQWEVLVQVGDVGPFNVCNTLDGPDPAGPFNPVLIAVSPPAVQAGPALNFSAVDADLQKLVSDITALKSRAK